MIQASELRKYFDLAYAAHQNHAKEVDKEYRQRDSNGKKQGPFVTHTWWCALMMMNDSRLPRDVRELGYKVLLLHDVLEDTNLPLPDFVEPSVVELVKQMTFETWEEEKIAVRKGSLMLKLLKLFDKVATMYDEAIRPDPIKRKEWKELVIDLVRDVEKIYPDARIIVVAKAILPTVDW